MKSKIICEMSGQDIKMLMILFLYFVACAAVWHLPSAAPRTALGWLTPGRERNPQRLLWMGGGVVFTNSMSGRLEDKGFFEKNLKWWMFVCNCEIMSRRGLRPSEVSTTIPIVKAQAGTSCECQKQWQKKTKKGCLQPFGGLIPPALPPQSPPRQVTAAQGGCLPLWTST